MLHKETTEKVIGASFEVYNQLGNGFLEKVYKNALQVELIKRGCVCRTEHEIKVSYKGKAQLLESTLQTCSLKKPSLSNSRSQRNTIQRMKHNC